MLPLLLGSPAAVPLRPSWTSSFLAVLLRRPRRLLVLRTRQPRLLPWTLFHGPPVSCCGVRGAHPWRRRPRTRMAGRWWWAAMCAGSRGVWRGVPAGRSRQTYGGDASIASLPDTGRRATGRGRAVFAAGRLDMGPTTTSVNLPAPSPLLCVLLVWFGDRWPRRCRFPWFR